MKRLFWLVLFAVAAWYGWQHRANLLHPEPTDEAVVVNATNTALLRVRVTVDGQTIVREVIEPGASSTLPFKLAHESDFQVEWQWRGRDGMVNWRGGLVTPGPVPTRTTLTAYGDGTVLVAAAALSPDSGGR